MRQPSAAKQRRDRRAKMCQLGCEDHNALAVATLHRVRVCQAHYDMIDAMVVGARGEGLPKLEKEKAA